MATVPASLANFGDLVDESIQDIFIKRGEQPTKMDQYFHVETTTSYYDKDSSVAGLTKAKYISENASVVYDAPIQGFDKTLRILSYVKAMFTTFNLKFV